MAAFVFVPVGDWRDSAFRRHPREKREKISAGAEEKECPPERDMPLNRICDEPSATVKAAINVSLREARKRL